MAEGQFKRNVALKQRIGDILMGKPVFDGEKFLYIELGAKHLTRVNIVGNIVDKYDSDGEKKYSFMTLDDGSGQIKLKVFGEEDVNKFKDITSGQTVTVIGVLRHWNNETYIQPEGISEKDPKYLLLRKLETEKERNELAQSSPQPTTTETASGEEQTTPAATTGTVKDKILDAIQKSEDDGGIDTEQIIIKFQETSPEEIQTEVQKLLEEGIIFEPRPGRLRYLG